MRILLVNYEYPPIGGGAATASKAIGKALMELGHSVTVLTGSFKELPARYEEDGLVIHRVPSFRAAADRCRWWEMLSFLVGGLLYTPAIIRKHRIEAAIAFFSLPCGPLGLFGRWICKVPYLVLLLGADVPGAEPSLNFAHYILRPLRRAILRNSIAAIANSEGLKNMANAADPFRYHVIPHGVDTELFAPPLSKDRKSEHYLRILFVGRFQTQKNLPFLLNQVAQLPANSFELHLVGDGPQKNHLQQLAEQIGIARNIIWHGWVPRGDLPEIYRAVDCLVNQSQYEGMSNVVLEAMASGLTVVASNVAGNDALVLHGETGFLFELDEPNGLRSALLQLLDDAPLRLRMGECARRRALASFSWKSAASQYLDLLSDPSEQTRQTKDRIER